MITSIIRYISFTIGEAMYRFANFIRLSLFVQLLIFSVIVGYCSFEVSFKYITSIEYNVTIGILMGLYTSLPFIQSMWLRNKSPLWVSYLHSTTVAYLVLFIVSIYRVITGSSIIDPYMAVIYGAIMCTTVYWQFFPRILHDQTN